MIKNLQLFFLLTIIGMISMPHTNASIGIDKENSNLFSRLMSAFQENLIINQSNDLPISHSLCDDPERGQSVIFFSNSNDENPYSIVLGSAVSVVSHIGVVNPDNAIGDPNGSVAFLYDASDEIILDLGTTISAGQYYSIIWHKKTAYGNGTPADMLVAESTNSSSGFVNHPNNPSSTNLNTYTTTNLIANVNVRYLKLKTLTGVGDDFVLDAVTHSNNVQNEICDNGIDDDGDGFVDCADNDCENYIDCTIAKACITLGPNLIVNGDFEQGYYAFSSDLGRGKQNSTTIGCTVQGYFSVGPCSGNGFCTDYNYPGNSNLYGAPGTMTPSNPSNPHNAVSTSCSNNSPCEGIIPDHTTGTGNVMFVDPDSRTGTAYWKQTVNIQPNTNYIFSAFIYARDSPEAEFYFKIGSKQLNETRQYILGQWSEAYALWNSGSNSGAIEVSLINTIAGCNGNDLYLDDIYLGTCINEICGDGIDNDSNGLTDCDDPICTTPSVTGSVIGNNNCSGTSATLNATATGGSGSYSYAWNNGGGSGASVSVSPTSTTTYTVTVTDTNGCTDTDQVVVTVTSNFTNGGTIGTNEARCTSFNPANITNVSSPSSGSGGTIQYLWQKRESNGSGGWSSWSTISGATALTYNPPTITVTTQYRRIARRLSCTQWRYSNVVTKTVNDIPVVNAGVNVSVCAGETVNLSASATGGDNSYIYTWDNGLGTGASKSFTGVASNTSNSITDYTVTVTDGNTCNDTDIVRVTVLSMPDVSVTSTNEYCGQDNGTITFTFTDNTNRTGITFSINNGTTYSYSTGDNLGSYTVTGLSAGSYQLYSRWGDSSCPVSLGSVTLSDVTAPSVIASVTDNDICVGETVSLNAAGSNGSGSLSYVWNNGGGTGASVSVSPTTTTTYTVTISDNQGCTDTDQVTVNVTNNFDSGGTIGSNESNCGSFNPANITNVSSPSSGSGGTIQYLWQKRESNGSGGWNSWSTINGETSLTYNPPTITVTTRYRRIARRLSCTQWRYSNVVTKTVNDIPVVNAGVNVSVCAGETVNLSASATGGDNSYIYTWDNGLGTGASKSFTGVASNTSNSITDYTVTVTDGNTCNDTDIVRVTVLSMPDVSVTSTNEYCGQDNGTITFTFTDNTNRTGITFSINNGTTYSYSTGDNLGSYTVTGLSAGSYQLYSRWGDSSCPVSLGSVTLSDVTAPSVIASVTDNDICVGETVSLNAAGSNGSGSLSYVWNNGGGTGASVSVSPTTTTTYTVTISDNQGCTDTDQVTVNVTNNFDGGGTIGSNESNCGSFNPTNITNVSSPSSGSGGTIQYLWQKRESNGSGGWNSWSTINGETSLTYNPPTITVTTRYRRIARRLPCTQWRYSNVVTKTVNDIPVVNAGVNVSVCAGETVNLSATGSGGTGVLSYSWDNGLGNGANHTFVPVASSSSNVTTVYTVTVEDTEGCRALADVTVTVESEPSIVVNTSDEHCNQSDGYISVSFIDNIDRTQIEFSIDGGTTYPYAIQDNNSFFIIGSLSAGSYDLWARWGGGDCPVSIQSIILNNSVGISVLASPDENVCEGEGVMITATASGGTFPYLYTWNKSLGIGQTKRISPIETTTYSVTSTDNFGCTAIDELVITVLPYTDEECSSCSNPVDLDGDGLCASRDCNDEDPGLPAPVGSSCDDGNAFTTNDKIQQDSCTCLGSFLPCSTSLSVLLEQPDYNDNGTPSNLSDDSFTFDVIISGNGNGWIANGQTGNYGQSVTFGPYAVDAVGISFDVLDQDNPNCRENISVNISSCIYSGVCTCCN